MGTYTFLWLRYTNIHVAQKYCIFIHVAVVLKSIVQILNQCMSAITARNNLPGHPHWLPSAGLTTNYSLALLTHLQDYKPHRIENGYFCTCLRTSSSLFLEQPLNNSRHLQLPLSYKLILCEYCLTV